MEWQNSIKIAVLITKTRVKITEIMVATMRILTTRIIILIIKSVIFKICQGNWDL